MQTIVRNGRAYWVPTSVLVDPLYRILTNPRPQSFRQLDLWGSSVSLMVPAPSQTFEIEAMGTVECDCGQEADIVCLGSVWKYLVGDIPVYGNDCCDWICSAGDHVCNRQVDCQCENCEACQDCCDCPWCSACENNVSETLSCGECARCCEHFVCGRCDAHTEWGCSHCQRCEDCCSCVYCQGCDEPRDDDDFTCEDCGHCSSCCSCETTDGDENGEEIEILLPYRAGEFLSGTGRTFGIELEHSGMSPVRAAAVVTGAGMPCRFRDYTHDYIDQWKTVTDSSVHGGGECVSPILRGDDGHAQLSSVMLALRANGASVNASCGTHVHIGVMDLTAAEIVSVVRFYDDHHSLIDMIHVPSRRGSAEWSGPYRDNEKATLDAIATLPDIPEDERKIRFARCERYRSVNVSSYPKYGTIEFRQHAGTLNYAKLSAWIGFLMALVDAAKDGAPRSKDLPTLLSTLTRYGLSPIHVDYLTTRALDLVRG